ncbi:MAG: alpha-galactosidase [Bacteroidales bacterium]|nr:alpha-galactosidase [Bacteroidales bacterium]
MKLSSIITAAAVLMLSAFGAEAENSRVINIRTEKSSLVFSVNPDGMLVCDHYGAAIGDASSFSLRKNYIRGDHGTPYAAYPAMGGRSFGEPALAVTHRNGDLNTELKYVSHTTETLQDNNISETTISLADSIQGLETDLVFTAYWKQNIITAHTVIRNREKGDITLRSFYSSALPIKAEKYLLTHLYGAWAREAQVDRTVLTHGTKSIESRKGVRTTHTESPAFMVSLDTDRFDENNGDVIAGALAWSGNFKLNFEVDEFNILTILAGANPYASEYRLKKGESFTTPEMIWTFSAEGAGGASRNLHRWARDYWMHSGSGTVPSLLNSWEGAYFNFDAKTLTDMIDDAASMGLEMFVLDDGWFGNKYPRNNDKAGLGDWDVNKEKLPEGIDYLASYAHEKGLRFGIWIEPEMVNPKSETAEKHPDWIVKGASYETTLIRNQWLLDMSLPAVQDFVFNVFDRTMSLSDKIDYIKWDANRHVENAGSNGLPDDRQSEFWIRYVQGFYNVMERIRKKYPDVMVQACASGGGRVEYGALKYFDEFWTSDNTEALSRTKIQYGTSLFFPANVIGSHVSAVPNHQTGNITPLKFRFDIACSGRLGMELQPKHMTDDEKAFARKAIESYKGYRDIIMNGDLWRIGSPYDDCGYYGMMYVSEDKSKAVLFTYSIKYQSRTVIPQFRLRGLDPERSYHFKEINVDKPRFWFDGKTLPGDLLEAKGVNIPLRGIYESAVFIIEAE